MCQDRAGNQRRGRIGASRLCYSRRRDTSIRKRAGVLTLSDLRQLAASPSASSSKYRSKPAGDKVESNLADVVVPPF
jgi:hypothetical protein